MKKRRSTLARIFPLIVAGSFGGSMLACGNSDDSGTTTGRSGSGGSSSGSGGSTTGKSGAGGSTGGSGGSTGGSGGSTGGSGGSTGGAAGSTGGSGGSTGGAAGSTGGTAGKGGTAGSGGTTGGSAGSGGTAGTTGTGGAAGGKADAGSTGGTAGTGGAAGSGGTGTTDGGTCAAGDGGTSKFSFFVTSLAAVREQSGSQNGFGGDLSLGLKDSSGAKDGLAGADEICRRIADKASPGSGCKQWRAFLSVTKSANNGPAVNAIDRVGAGPWYDRLGRLVAMTKANLAMTRPSGMDAAIVNDFPNETGTPNHNPDNTGNVDNHDMLTGSSATGTLMSGGVGQTCKDWTSAVGADGQPRVGHSWPAGSGMNWMSALNEAGCAPGVSLVEMGPPDPSNPTVGSGGGYGGFYCFALTP